MSDSRQKAWVAWSSGKDSLWALSVARRRPDLNVTGLLTTVTEPYHRVSMHAVREELVEAQAASLGLPLHRVYIPSPCSDEQYSTAMRSALDVAQEQGVTRMMFGDLYLEDVRAYREQRLAGTGIDPVFPLWNSNTGELAREMIAGGVRAYLTCLDPRVMPREMAGRAFDADLLDALPPGIDACGERGEFHTFAWDGPGLSQPVPVTVGETVEREGLIFTDLVTTG
jgi:uncharacterized protein (TIGR00290 family)